MLPRFFFDYLLLLSHDWKEEANASTLSFPPLFFIGVHGRSLSCETELLRRFNLPSIQGLAARPLLFFFTCLHFFSGLDISYEVLYCMHLARSEGHLRFVRSFDMPLIVFVEGT